jgi:LacI family transcriptional regulator
MAPYSPTRHVALLVETSNAYARGLLTGVRQFARERPGWSLFLAEHSRTEDDFSWLEGWQGHGVLARIETAATAGFVRSLGLPTVDLSAKRLVPELPCFETDDALIADWAEQHFTQRGLRTIAYCGDDRFGWSLERGEALARRAAADGRTLPRFHLDPRARLLDERTRLAHWLAALPHPVGVLACYDIAGREVLEACALAGLAVPDTVAVLGVDNDELLCDLASPPLSSIQPDAVRTGFLAAELLDGAMAGLRAEPAVRPVAPLRLVERASTNVLAMPDALVAAAVRFIRDTPPARVSVAGVARHVGLSRRSLDQRFVTHVGHTVHAEVQRVRLLHVCELLVTTDWSLARICTHLELGSPEYLSVAFKRQTGETPGEYRRRVRMTRPADIHGTVR